MQKIIPGCGDYSLISGGEKRIVRNWKAPKKR
jgi:hypothetical protein